jgi:hypothetical protein
MHHDLRDCLTIRPLPFRMVRRGQCAVRTMRQGGVGQGQWPLVFHDEGRIAAFIG